MAEEKKTTPLWRLEDQEWWKKYSAMVNGTAKEEDLPAPPECPTVPGGMVRCELSGGGSGLRVHKMPCLSKNGQVDANSAGPFSSGSGRVGSGSAFSGSGSGSGGYLLGYGLHLI